MQAELLDDLFTPHQLKTGLINSFTPETASGGDTGSAAEDQRLREQGYVEVREDAKYVHNTHNHNH